MKKRFRVKLQRPDGIGTGAFMVLPFDPREVFGKARAPVRVTIGAHTYRSTVAIYGGIGHVVINEANRRAANVQVGETVSVVLERDDAPRVVKAPSDLAAALAKDAKAKKGWEKLSYTHKKEHVAAILGAKKPETRARRLANAVAILTRPPA